MKKFVNRENVLFVAKHLRTLKDDMVFIGGSVIELLLDQSYPLETRISYDVDTVVEIASRREFSELEKKLRHLGFKNDRDLICRWHIGHVLVDIMPTDKSILGFSNRWYKGLFDNAKPYKLAVDYMIKLVTAPYLLATKFEAFEQRGNRDYVISKDMEDIITLIDGRSTLIDEIIVEELTLRSYLKEKFEQYLTIPDFYESLPGHLASYNIDLPERVERTKRVITQVVCF
jgi:predicted nucleotidyltransferase